MFDKKTKTGFSPKKNAPLQNQKAPNFAAAADAADEALEEHDRIEEETEEVIAAWRKKHDPDFGGSPFGSCSC